MAAIRKRGDYSYEVQVRRRGFPTLTKTFTYRADAEKWARQIEAEQERGAYVHRTPAERVTMNDIFDKYEEDVLPKMRGKSAKPALRLLREEFGKLSLAGLQSAQVAAFRDKRAKAGKAASTIRKEINLLSKIINLASKEWGYPIAINPCSMVSRPSEADSARDRRLLEGEEKLLLAAAKKKGKHHLALVRLAIETGTRLGELLHLEWGDLDLKSKVATIRGIEINGVQQTKNKDKSRLVPLSPAAVAAIGTLQGKGKVKTLEVGRLFPWSNSDSFTKPWRALVAAGRKEYEEAGGKDSAILRDLRFHDLRHEAASRLAQLLEMHHLQKLLGHKTPAMTSRYYQQSKDDVSALAARLVRGAGS